jgi:hypothetical protein
MIQFKQLKVSFDYSREHDQHNHDLVGYVVQKYPRKVVKASILTRASVDSWYKEVQEKYSKKHHVFLLGTISLIGTVLGMANVEESDNVEDDDDSPSTYRRPKDPSAN